MKKMIKTDNLGQMSPSCLLLNPYLPLTLPLRAPKRMMYLFAVLAMLLLGGWNTQAWGGIIPHWYYAKLTVNTSPSGTGKVIVDTEYKTPSAESDWEDIRSGLSYNNANVTLFVDDVPTGIRTVTTNQDKNDVYDLSGRKVNSDKVTLQKGVYIGNGKKETVR